MTAAVRSPGEDDGSVAGGSLVPASNKSPLKVTFLAPPIAYYAITAYAHGSGRESLPPDVEVEVRAGERVECSPYVPADGATT